jgi:hypothetical protein
MDGQIEEVITGDVEPAESVIEGKSELSDDAAGKEIPAGTAGEEIAEVPDDFVVGNRFEIIDNKGDPEAVGIGQGPEKEDEQDMEKRVANNYFQHLFPETGRRSFARPSS